MILQRLSSNFEIDLSFCRDSFGRDSLCSDSFCRESFCIVFSLGPAAFVNMVFHFCSFQKYPKKSFHKISQTIKKWPQSSPILQVSIFWHTPDAHLKCTVYSSIWACHKLIDFSVFAMCRPGRKPFFLISWKNGKYLFPFFGTYPWIF